MAQKSKPRNWMTPGASYTFGLEGDELAIHAEQSSSEGVEELDIWVADVYDIITERLLDDRGEVVGWNGGRSEVSVSG